VGLPSTIPFGAGRHFVISGDAVAAGGVQVTMRDAESHHVFYRAEARPRSRFAIELDRGERTAEVVVRWTSSQPRADGAGREACAGTVTRAVAGQADGLALAEARTRVSDVIAARLDYDAADRRSLIRSVACSRTSARSATCTWVAGGAAQERRGSGVVRVVRVGTRWRVRSDLRGRRVRGSQVLGSFRWRD
jgi:hypothetical protein